MIFKNYTKYLFILAIFTTSCTNILDKISYELKGKFKTINIKHGSTGGAYKTISIDLSSYESYSYSLWTSKYGMICKWIW